MSATTDSACARLQEADKAYHALVTGQAGMMYVDQNGERIQYTPANLVSLLDYIRQLQPLCTTYTALIPTGIGMTTPLRPVF